MIADAISCAKNKNRKRHHGRRICYDERKALYAAAVRILSDTCPRGSYKVGQKPVGTDMIENVLAKDINGLEPRLTRQGYNAKVLADLLNVKPREIKSFLSGHLAPGRTQELQTELLAAGIPL